MLLECHTKTAEHPIPVVVPARHVRGHLGVVIPKLGSDERSNGETERKRPKPINSDVRKREFSRPVGSTNFIHGHFATRPLLRSRCRKLVPLLNVNVVSLLCIYRSWIQS